MSWTTKQLAGLVEPDRAHRKAYTDPEIFDLEMERIFERTWVYAGHESEVAGPGDYVRARICRPEVIVVRDDKGGLSGFYNENKIAAQDGHEAFKNMQKTISSRDWNGRESDWLNVSRGYGDEVRHNNGARQGVGASEVGIRNQLSAWSKYMTGELPSAT